MSLLDSFLTESDKISLERPVLMQKLESTYKHPGYKGLCLYGQRQIGKTFLLNQFIKDKPAIYYQATGQSSAIAATVLRNLAAQYIERYFTDTTAKKFLDLLGSCDEIDEISGVLELIFSLSTVKPFVFIIDEYPCLLKEFPALDSILQAIIDKIRDWENFNITFIICGSSLEMTARLGYQAPLFMRLEPLEVWPFTFWESLPLLASYSHEDAFKVYSVTGGYPGYLQTAAEYSTFDTFLQEALLSPCGILRSYLNKYLLSENLISFEGKTIIEAIADGNSYEDKIRMASKLSDSEFSKTFSKLLAVGVIASKQPLYSENLEKSRSYYINIPLLAFWSYIAGGVMNIQHDRIP